MQKTAKKLQPAIDELKRANHDQDITEAPKRAQLDRAAEGARFFPPIIAEVKDNQ